MYRRVLYGSAVAFVFGMCVSASAYAITLPDNSSCNSGIGTCLHITNTGSAGVAIQGNITGPATGHNLQTAAVVGVATQNGNGVFGYSVGNGYGVEGYTSAGYAVHGCN